MEKTAFIFPGQGAQKAGMGKDFYQYSSHSRRIFDQASKVLGFSMEELCFEENNRLDITEYTQAAMVTASMAMMAEIQNRGFLPDMTAGLSLGEYCAMIVSGVISFPDAVKVVRQRGILMQEAVPAGQGGMAAILGLDTDKIEAVISSEEDVQIANYNCPGQIVISGKKEAVELACVKLKEAGAKRAVILNVSGPFHSAMLFDAGKKLAKVLADIEFKSPVIPYVTNVTAEFVTDSNKGESQSVNQIKQLLEQQVSSSVRWQQSIEKMIAAGAGRFVEIGPGKTLTAFVRKISRDVQVYNVETWQDLEKLEKLRKAR